MIEVVVKRHEKFNILYDLPEGTNTVILIGGRGGMKTYEASKFVAFESTIRKKRCVILRDEKELIRESILNEVLTRFDTANADGALSARYQRLDTGIKDKLTNEMMVFTKGFRASDSQKRANLKSISNIDIAVIEEAEDIRDVDKFNTFADSIRKENSVIVTILNTPDIGHWIIERYFDTIQTEHDGYFELTPKKIPGFVCIQTSFEDNKWLPQHIVDNYRGYGDPSHHLYNLHYYLTAIKGYASSGRKGQVLKKAQPITLEEYMKLPFKEYYGQDFGTSSPAGMVGVKFDKNNCYARELNYLPMNTLEIGKLYCRLGLTAADKVVADNADPKAIAKLRGGWKRDEISQEDADKYPGLLRGFYVVPCVKGRDSIEAGIDLLDSMNLFVVSESKNFWNEIRLRIYAQDKNGNYTNVPEPGYDHLQDPLTYVTQDQRGKRQFKVMTQ